MEKPDVVYSGRDFIIIYKPSGMLSEGENGAPGAVRQYLTGNSLPFDDVFTVHRLDRTTAGLMVYALNKKTAAALSAAITDGRFHKTYMAYIRPDILSGDGEMRDFLFFDRNADKSFVVGEGKKGAKEAVLHYTVTDTVTLTDRFGDEFRADTAVVELLTGRTHQIRVQFASRKAPLIGDGKYGSRIKYDFPSLFSKKISFSIYGRTYTYEA